MTHRRNVATGLLSLFFASLALAVPRPADPLEDHLAFIDSLVEKADKPDKRVTAYLVDSFHGKDAPLLLQERAVWALGRLELRKEVDWLVKASQSPSLIVRSAGLDALMHLRAQTGLETYIEIAHNDPVLSLRQRATLALGLTRSDKAIDSLVKLSSDRTVEVRAAAVLAMAALHSKRNDFTEIMTEMAEKDPSLYVRSRTEAGLEIVKRKNRAVRTRLTSEDPDMRLFAALYLHHHGREPDLPALNAAYDGEAADGVRHEIDLAIKGISKRVRAERLRKAKEEAAEKAAEKALKNQPSKTTP